MEITDYIRLGQQEPPLPFLIIGGYAVAAHGHTRATFDVDFLVRAANRDEWFARLESAELKLFAQTKTFAQFSQPREGDGLDLMFVDEATFDRLWQSSETRDFGGVAARVPCLDHLLALKLHALRQAQAHRTSKDADDVEVLLRRNQINLRAAHYEQLFLKYGNREIYAPSFASCEIRDAARPSLDFELPDGEGFASLPPQVTLETVMQRSRQLRLWFPQGIPTAEERWQAKTDVEFKL